MSKGEIIVWALSLGVGYCVFHVRRYGMPFF